MRGIAHLVILFELTQKVAKLRRDSPPTPVKNYKFKTTEGEVGLLDLFGNKDILFVVHNMGQGCRYCTLWADGMNGYVNHLESQFSLVVVSKDDPQTQRAFANSRGWRFNMASHGAGEYIKEQTVVMGESNMPGLVCYTRKGQDIFKKNVASFGPRDEWTPQYNYWKRSEKMDDGGKNLI